MIQRVEVVATVLDRTEASLRSCCVMSVTGTSRFASRNQRLAYRTESVGAISIDDVRIATPWHKPANNKTGRAPDYTLHETDKWLFFPYELTWLSRDEIHQNKTFLEPILDEIDQTLQAH